MSQEMRNFAAMTNNYTCARLLACIIISAFTLQATALPRLRKSGSSSSGWVLPQHDSLPAKLALDIPMSAPVMAVIPKEGSRAAFGTGREGIDISHYQGMIDWKVVAQSGEINYVYMKCTEGANYVDPTYARNSEQARRAGLPVGVYHFYKPEVSPQQQFENLIRVAKREDMDLLPMIDVEHRGKGSDASFVSNLKKFVELVTDYYGCRPLMYSGQNFYNKFLAGHFKDYVWMMAKYHETPPACTDGLDYCFWQFTSSSRVPGIQGNVDKSCIMEGHSLEEVAL